MTDILAALLTPLIAVIALYIAYQQWRTNHLRFKHELFDRRFDIYKAVQVYLSEIMRDAKVNPEKIPALLDAMQRSRFLMGPDIPTYINEVFKRGTEMTKHQEMYAELPVGAERSELVKRESRELRWLTDQLPMLADRFGPYLSLTESERPWQAIRQRLIRTD